jgi:hypothetical protein
MHLLFPVVVFWSAVTSLILPDPLSLTCAATREATPNGIGIDPVFRLTSSLFNAQVATRVQVGWWRDTLQHFYKGL